MNLEITEREDNSTIFDNYAEVAGLCPYCGEIHTATDLHYATLDCCSHCRKTIHIRRIPVKGGRSVIVFEKGEKEDREVR